MSDDNNEEALRKELDGMIERVLTLTDPDEDMRAVLCRVYLDGYAAGMARIQRSYEQSVQAVKDGVQL